MKGDEVGMFYILMLALAALGIALARRVHEYFEERKHRAEMLARLKEYTQK